MKLAWILFGVIISLLLIFAIWRDRNMVHENLASDTPQTYSQISKNGGQTSSQETAFFLRSYNKAANKYTARLPKTALPDSIVTYGLSLMGTPYRPAGITQKGFDCSGFVYHVFNKYKINLPHSSNLLASEGISIPLTEARKGDILVFTGTNEADRTPGHVGVVVTEPGQPVEFVHASSEGGVKVSKIAGTGYADRFLDVRRITSEST